MTAETLRRHLKSFVLPTVVVIVVPFFQIVVFSPLGLRFNRPFPFAQILLGMILFICGLILFFLAVRLFSGIGKGTLAPWDPTRKLVTQGIYGHLRNPMITGVLFMLLGEALFFGLRSLFIWALIFFIVNTVYFKLFEEPGLAKRFGREYMTYQANVPMWIPRIKPWIPDDTKPQCKLE